MEYEEAMRFLRDLGRFGTNLGLERMGMLLGEVGDPHRKLAAIHVAGTNGKGSVSAMLDSVLRQAGYKVGLYTSPHLSSWTERIRVNGRNISEGDVARIIGWVRPLVEQVSSTPGIGHPTEFEVSTLAAFLHFAQVGVDICVIEVGLGGRLDATNVIHPIVSVITRIGLDHMDKLGATLGEIASEKAGIIKEGVPVVSAEQHPEALEVISGIAHRRHAELRLVGRDISYERRGLGLWGQTCDLRWAGGSLEGVYLPLCGPHQAMNAATAAGVLLFLADRGWNVDEAAIRRGFAATRWPGRFEIVQRRPTVILDGAHNSDGVSALSATLEESTGGRKVTAVLGFSKDKDLSGMAYTLFPLCERIIATQAKSTRTGAIEPRAIATEARSYGIPADVVPDAREATKMAISIAQKSMGSDGDVVLVAGSLYLVGEVRPLWRALDGFPEPREGIVIFAGGFGAGKTEVAVNYALGLARRGGKVAIGDMDIVRPYFRSREAKDILGIYGIEVISSALGTGRADIPAIDPALYSLFKDRGRIAVLDVGGDEAGARILRRFACELEGRRYELNFVFNANRPDTRDVASALGLLQRIEEGSGLKFTGIVSNTHMGELTAFDDIRRGIEIAKCLALRSGVPLRFVAVEARLLPYLEELPEVPVFPLELFMRPPWDAAGFIA